MDHGQIQEIRNLSPKDNITLLEGYTEEEIKNIKAIIDDCKDVIWDMARY